MESDTIRFKSNVKEYLYLSTKIEHLKIELKKYRTDQKNIEDDIKTFMMNNEINDVNSKNMKLKYSMGNRKKTLTKKLLSEQIERFLIQLENDTNDDDESHKQKAEKMTHFIYSTREKVSISSLNVNIKKK